VVAEHELKKSGSGARSDDGLASGCALESETVAE
jgi:hypothetical protein